MTRLEIVMEAGILQLPKPLLSKLAMSPAAGMLAPAAPPEVADQLAIEFQLAVAAAIQYLLAAWPVMEEVKAVMRTIGYKKFFIGCRCFFRKYLDKVTCGCQRPFQLALYCLSKCYDL